MMWNSLRVRLVLLFMLVVLVAVGTVALLANQGTATNLQIYEQAMGDPQITSTQLIASRQYQSQQALTGQFANGSPLSITSNERQMTVMTSSGLAGQAITSPIMTLSTPLSSPARVLSTDIQLSGQVGGSGSSLALEQGSGSGAVQPLSYTPGTSTIAFRTGSPSPEAAFLTAMNQSLWQAVLVAGLVALLLAQGFTSALLKPLHMLQAVAVRMAQGDLSQRVSITDRSEIGALAHAFNIMAESLSRSEQARRDLINDVAHELRNPLMNIRGSLELLADHVLEPTPETLSSLYEESSLLTRLVSDLQDFSLMEAGQLRLVCRPIVLADVVSQAVQMVQPQLKQKHLELRVALFPHLPPVNADPERVAQILRNLLSNAIRYTSSPGEIRITASQCSAMIHVSVQDTGAGIAPEHLPHLFERFYRADTTCGRANGSSGLGLAIVKQMVQAHGGQITVTSQPGEGACFTFTLPVASNTTKYLA